MWRSPMPRPKIVVGLDADTPLAPDALARLATLFDAERIGAVAGNASGLVPRWQSIEYVTSPNVDRWAYRA